MWEIVFLSILFSLLFLLRRSFTLIYKLFAIIRRTLKIWGCVDKKNMILFWKKCLIWRIENGRQKLRNRRLVSVDFFFVSIRHRVSCFGTLRRANIPLKQYDLEFWTLLLILNILNHMKLHISYFPIFWYSRLLCILRCEKNEIWDHEFLENVKPFKMNLITYFCTTIDGLDRCCASEN